MKEKDSGAWGKDLIEASSNKLSRRYQEHIFKDLKAEDYQEMAELYMPQNYERKGELPEQDAFQLWLKTYQNGILTQGDVAEFGSGYKKKDNYVKNPKTKDDISEMFGFKKEEPVYEPQPKGLQDHAEEQKQLDTLKQMVDAGIIPTVKDELGNEYLRGRDGMLMPVKNIFKDTKADEQEAYDLSQESNSPAPAIHDPELMKTL
jgi:hypothetical protein